MWSVVIIFKEIWLRLIHGRIGHVIQREIKPYVGITRQTQDVNKDPVSLSPA